MFKVPTRATLSLFICSIVALSAEARTPGFNETDRCRVDTDSFAIPAYVPGLFPGEGREGPLSRRVLKPGDAGQCVMQSEYRPVVPLTESEISGFGLERDNARVYVGNVRTLDGWYAASIPLFAAREALFMISIRRMPVLGVRGGHSEIRVKFGDDVILIPHDNNGAEETLRTRELVFTANPTGFDGPSRYDPVKNFDGSLLNARGIQTIENRLNFSFIKSHTFTTRQYQLKMSSLEIAAYIKQWIKRADETRLQQRFILTKMNCDAAQFEVLDTVLSHRYHKLQKPFDPEFAQKRLLERKLIDENSEVAPFESEPWAQEMFQKYGRMPEGH
jgi:hypothetical protein